MRWTIRNQIFVPFAILLAMAVATSAITSSVIAVRRVAAWEVEHVSRVLRSIEAAGFPFTASVLERLRGLTGAEFAVMSDNQQIVASTLPDVDLTMLSQAPVLQQTSAALPSSLSMQVGSTSYLVAAVPVRTGMTMQQVYVLYPQDALQRLQREAAWPPLAIGGATLLLMLLVSGWIANRFSRRIDSVRLLFEELQGGRFPRLEPPQTRDELRTLVESANELSIRLEGLQNEIRRTERLRVLAQLAGGFAHQLRNAVTGARMAVQLHQRQSEGCAADESLSVALVQLRLTEQQVQGLLSLSREPNGPTEEGELREILADVESLLQPHCRHLRIALRMSVLLQERFVVSDRNALRAALLNLCLNALEAAGVDGEVEVTAQEREGLVEIQILDNGAGPPVEIEDRVFEPFVTGKPEGIGLGLALAQQAAEVHQGTLTWSRQNGRTQFKLRLPRQVTKPSRLRDGIADGILSEEPPERSA